ncbi:uncharacterized, partial [Tachysurus ichikawai]
SEVSSHILLQKRKSDALYIRAPRAGEVQCG